MFPIFSFFLFFKAETLFVKFCNHTFFLKKRIKNEIRPLFIQYSALVLDLFLKVGKLSFQIKLIK